MREATGKILSEMRRLVRATCPELASAAGLSLVTTHREVAHLCALGELRATEAQRTLGGRPARVYACREEHAAHLYIEVRRQGGLERVQMEVGAASGRILRRSESTYAALESQSLDGRIDETLQRMAVRAISLCLLPMRESRELRAHLAQRYACPVASISPVEALADEREGTATLYLAAGHAPQCCLYHGGRPICVGRPELLPMPSTWEAADYSDRTLVAEMVARLLQIIACTLMPERIVAYADYWAPRLVERIRFNTAAKLPGYTPPPVSFRACTAAAAMAATRAYAHAAAQRALSPPTGTSDASPPARPLHTD